MQLSDEQLEALAIDALSRFQDSNRMSGTNGGLYRFGDLDVHWSRKRHGVIQLHVMGVDYDLPIC